MPESDSLSRSVNVTSFAPLSLVQGRWQVGKVQRAYGMAIDSVSVSAKGEVFAVAAANKGDDTELKLVLLEQDKLAWQERSTLPGSFGVLTSWVGLRDFIVGKNAIVVNTSSEHEVPRLLYPWGRNKASISGNGVFYSVDGGKSWKRLAMNGYLGLLGLDSRNDRVMWSKGSWYESRDANVYSYGLQ
ncbi:hypothetical protein VVD49_00770 [Uliginosibacterium sp. H3]|uniref:Glycosyl hydrolase n=1 Tax=Uliginosibacterium silvisoli TaxID=3114758 RepID=A0ABU6JXY3_9RHOO|nr:hypothetical protein [Uliginosibacterium sp. H3]